MLDYLQTLLAGSLASGSLMVYGLVFIGGVVASFTPCTYPVLPLTIGYIGNASDGNRGKAALMGLFLVFGMALVYALVGIIFAAIGMQFGVIWASGWAVFAIAWFFILMSLFLMEVFTFPIPRFLQKIQGKASGQRKGLFGAFVVGCVSGLVVGPCTGPILGIVLVAVATTLEQAAGIDFLLAILSGGAKLFLFGLGQGTLILLCAIFAGLLSHLPKSGKWLIGLKKGFAMMILIGASLLLVYAGQATDFPDLTGLLTNTEKSTVAAPDAAADSSANNIYGGDEFLK